jgi:hypothetical protein
MHPDKGKAERRAAFFDTKGKHFQADFCRIFNSLQCINRLILAQISV